MNEANLIRLITQGLPTNADRLTPVFTADAEHLRGRGLNLLVTMDDFSAEDLMRGHHPQTLGWNWAVASLSDVYAAGGHPWQYGHSMTVPDSWSPAYIEGLMDGVGQALTQADCGFFGGDLSRGAEWKYTATVLGTPGERVLTRVGSQPGDKIFLTGRIGRGNYEAALSLYADQPLVGSLTSLVTNRFPLRRRESQVLAPFARACIDTSDGVFSALNTVSELNHLGYQLDRLPLLAGVPSLASVLGLPALLLFLGGCGEYELLFTVAPEAVPDLKAAARAQNLTFFCLGTITDSPGQKSLVGRRGVQDLTPLVFEARDFPRVKDYLAALVRAIEKGGFHV